MKKIHIRMAEVSDRCLWDSYVLCHPEGTAYQLFAWGKAVELAYGFQTHNIIAEVEGRICGVMPLVKFRIPIIGEQLISLPYCDSGGILADDDGIAQVIYKRALAFAEERHGDCIIRSNCSLPFAGESGTDKVRMVLELPENSNALMASFRSKLRNKIKLPLRDGFVARMGGDELLSDFYRIFTENMRDLGSPVHGRQWFQAIVDSFEDKTRVGVVYASNGEPAAAGIILLHSNTVANPWSSSLDCYNKWKPNMLLYWTFLAFAADNGFKCFDFGRSTIGEGTWRFKDQWGATPKPLYWYGLESKGKKEQLHDSYASSSRKRQLAAALWCKLPLSAANWLGPRIRKYISL
jgi:FemAB-related protein (PEP-CTERM system-associated)